MEEEEIEVPVSKESAGENAKMETDEAPPADAAAPPSLNDNDVNMQDAKATTDAPEAKNGIPEAGDKPVQMDTDTKVDTDRKLNFMTSFIFGGLFWACHGIVWYIFDKGKPIAHLVEYLHQADVIAWWFCLEFGVLRFWMNYN